MRSNRKKRGNKSNKPNKNKNMYDEKTRKIVIEHYRASLGDVSLTCKKAGIGRTAFYEWLKKDEAFAAEIEQIKTEEFADFVESALKQRIQAGDTTAIIFALKTKFRERGWSDKQEVAVDVTSGGQPIRYANIMPKKKPDGTDGQTA